ncbi:DDE superfamily endonuclease [Methylosinus sp. sav-2]|nr:DDE superfamily endonuclease [Methylosinus sp. sav-2]
MIDFKGSHFERDVILWGVRWYVAYPMSYRQLEEMMDERGAEVAHSTLNRWVVKYAPLLKKQFRARKRAIGSSWRLDETYVKVKGCWKYLYRAVDKAGATVDFLLTAKRDRKAALRFLRKAIGRHGGFVVNFLSRVILGYDLRHQALQAVDHGDQYVADAAVFQLVHPPKPKFGALRGFDPKPQNVLRSVCRDAEREIDRLVPNQALIADFTRSTSKKTKGYIASSGRFRHSATVSSTASMTVDQATLGKNLLRIASRQQLVQCVLLNRNSSPPAVLLWPHTQDS